MSKVLIAASEALPFAASGGLGDVIGSLPAALVKADKTLDVRVVMPYYSTIEQKYKDEMTYLGCCTVMLSWRRQYCGIFSYQKDGVTYYFLDNEYYFKRPALYGEFDDGERFAFFSKAVLDFLSVVNFEPDILHANDWQTALSVIYFKKYRPQVKSIITIHNIQYQGEYSLSILGDVFELDIEDTEIVEYNGCINLLKGAIVCADVISTVSPTYAKEILSPKFSYGLHSVLELFKDKITGILNGIDQEYYNPKIDEEIFAKYDGKNIKNKYQGKKMLQEMLYLPEKSDTPILAVVSRLVDHKGLDLITLAADDILAADVQMIVLGKGEGYYEDFFKGLADRYPDKVRSLITYDKALAKKIYAGADIFVMPSKNEPCGLAQMIASRYGAVPVIHETGGLYDSIKDYGCPEGGNGFTFANYSAWELFSAVKRATDLYHSENWQELVKKVMETDFSWVKSAQEYIKMYSRGD